MSVEAKEYVEDVVIDRSADVEVEEQDTQAVDSEGEDQVVDIRARIAEKHNAQMEEEISGVSGQPKEEDTQVVDSTEEQEQTVEEEKSQFTEVIVNGRKVLAANVKIEAAGGIDNYQKRLAADEGLQTLAVQRKLLEDERKAVAAERRRIEELGRQQILPPAVEDEPAKRNVSKDRDAVNKQYHQAVYDGDEDTANVLLNELVEISAKMYVDQHTTPPQQVDANEIVNTALNEFRKESQQQQMQNDVVQAQAKFGQEYPEINSDAIAKGVANQKTIELHQAHSDWSPEQIVMEAGRLTREWMGTFKGDSGQQAQSVEKRVETKKNLGNVKPASGRSQAKPRPKAQTSSDYIVQLRKQRGLE